MDKKFKIDPEEQFAKLGEERFAQGKYKIFDKNSRLIKRYKLFGLNSETESGLLILNGDGEAILLTEEFERNLLRVFKIRYEK
jgi:hypothetical protein